MKFDELFPRSKFPGRMKTKNKVKISDNVTMRTSVFFEKPFMGLGDPRHTCGLSRVVFENGNETLAFAILFPKEHARARWFQCMAGDWVEISGSQEPMNEICEKHIRILGPNPFAGIEDAKWVQF
ncbi:MAG: hypothetical protein HYT37_03390 [Candidatus Sungbacteria bacterium]|nr:hypothetical protein [Candidatus Sungbacteria bacterium]